METLQSINTQGLFAQMSVAELERMSREISAFLYRKKAKDKALQERQLLSKINRNVLNNNEIIYYQTLLEKSLLGTITDSEIASFELLATREEKLRNLRVKYMIQLAQLRAISLPQVMESLGLTPLGRA